MFLQEPETKLAITIPDHIQLDEFINLYDNHLSKCDAILSEIPDAQRMHRRNAGFHSGVAVIGALANDLPPGESYLLEVGVWKGASLSFAALCGGAELNCFGIDPFQFQGQLNETRRIINSFGLNNNVRLFADTSGNVPREILAVAGHIDIIHIDGSHTFEDCARDILLYWHFLRPGGWMIVDDYFDNASSPEVRPAVDYIIEQQLLTPTTHGTHDSLESYLLKKDCVESGC